MRRTMIVVGVLFLMLASAVVPVIAQDQPADNMQILRDKLQADKKLVIAANMGFTQQEADGFWPLYEEYQKELMKLNDRTLALIAKYAENYSKMTDEIANELTKEHLTIQGERLKLLKNHLLKLRKVLSDKKVARYMQLENKISALIAYDLATQIPLVE